MLRQIIRTTHQWLSAFFTGLIKVYRYLLGPVLGTCCRFYPTCSHYAETAIHRFGILKGSYLAVSRILRCHPFHPGGYDPVPDREKV